MKSIACVNDGCAQKTKCQLAILAALSLGANPGGRPNSPRPAPSQAPSRVRDTGVST